jgi:hypothetical protein
MLKLVNAIVKLRMVKELLAELVRWCKSRLAIEANFRLRLKKSLCLSHAEA